MESAYCVPSHLKLSSELSVMTLTKDTMTCTIWLSFKKSPPRTVIYSTRDSHDNFAQNTNRGNTSGLF